MQREHPSRDSSFPSSSLAWKKLSRWPPRAPGSIFPSDRSPRLKGINIQKEVFEWNIVGGFGVEPSIRVREILFRVGVEFVFGATSGA